MKAPSGPTPRVVVIGAGPAGLRATEVLARAGFRPLLIDEAERPGGQIYRQPPAGAERHETRSTASRRPRRGRRTACSPASAQRGLSARRARLEYL